MVEAYRTDTIFGITDNFTSRMRDMISLLRGADRVAKTLQETLQNLNIGMPKMPSAAKMEAEGVAAGKAYARGFARGADMGGFRPAGGRRAGGGAGNGADGGGAAEPPRSPFSMARIAGPAGTALTPFVSAANVPLLTGAGREPPLNGGSLNRGGALSAVGSGGGSGTGGGGSLAPYGGSGGAAGGGGIPLNPGGGPPPPPANPWAALAGGHMLFSMGEELAHGLGHVMKHGMDYDSEISQLNVAGYTKEELAATLAMAWKNTAAVPTAGVTENLKVASELRYALGSAAHANEIMEPVMKLTGVLGSLTGGRLGASEAAKSVRAMEQLNRGTTPEQMQHSLEMLTGTAIASRGTIGGSQMLGFVKQTGSAFGRNFNDDYLFNYAPRLIQEMGGDRAGTASAAMMEKILGTTMSKKSAEEFERLGILDPKMTTGKGVNFRLKPGAMPDGELAATNPYLWFQKYMAKPILALPQAQQLPALVTAMGTRTAGRGAANYIYQGNVAMPGVGADGMPLSPYERDAAVTRSAAKDPYGSLIKTNPNLLLQAFNVQWENFTTALGHSVIPIIIPALQSMTNGLNEFAQFAMEHPDITAGALKTIATMAAVGLVLGGLGIAVGTIGLAFAALGAPIALIVGGLVSVVTWMALGGWGAHALGGALGLLSGAFSVLKNVVMSVINFVVTASKAVGNFVLGSTNEAPAKWMSSDDLAARREQRRSAARIEATPDTTVHTQISLDSRPIAQAVTRVQSRELHQPQSGTMQYDPRMSPTTPGQQ